MAARRRPVLPAVLLCALVAILGVTAARTSMADPVADAGRTLATGRTLGEAAGRPHGIGARDTKPRGSQRDAVAAPTLTSLRDKLGNRLTVQGCLIDYGGGQGCLPAVPPAAADMGMDEVSMPWTCAQVRAVLPRGIKVTGRDVLRLDANKDKVACGKGDG